jgi:RNA polymerase sigma-70 factor (ECF subfamily)
MGAADHAGEGKITAARIPYRVPSSRDLPRAHHRRARRALPRLQRGLPRDGPDTDPVAHDLTAEAIRLTRLIRALLPEDGEVAGCWR